jgi:hypothetical protein
MSVVHMLRAVLLKKVHLSRAIALEIPEVARS